ncbi:MAG: hypothetical protein RJA68_566, partial [Actinomycetota bacterium]
MYTYVRFDPVTWTSDTVLEALISSPPLELQAPYNEGQARDYGSVGQKTLFGANPYISIAAL